MKKNNQQQIVHLPRGRWQAGLLIGLVMILLTACSPAATPASTQEVVESTAPVAVATEAPTAETTEPIKLVMWWWGEQEAPGAEKWMNETISLYEKEHPNIKIESVLQSTDNLIPSFQSAIAAGSGPDIQYVWGGIYTLDFVWTDGLSPINDLIPADELSHYINNFERTYDGKIWGVPWYLSGNPLVYNKALFKEAGLDPEKPITTWDELLAACGKLREKGIIPISGGLKDGWYGGWLYSIVGRQSFDSEKELMEASVGNAKWTDPKYAEYWSRMQQLKDANCWNEDIMSLDQYQGLDMFVQKKSAMVLGNDTFLGNWINQMGADDIGVMPLPRYADGKLADDYVVTAQGLGITSWSEHPQEAADFLMFMHTPERLNAWFNATGVLPADNRMDTSLVKQPLIQQLYEWATTTAGPNLENFVPIQIDQEAWWSGVQLLFTGSKSPEELAQFTEDTAQKWRDQNPDSIQNWETWMK